MESVTLCVKSLPYPSAGHIKARTDDYSLLEVQSYPRRSLWALTVASRIVDLVHYASTPENNMMVAAASLNSETALLSQEGY